MCVILGVMQGCVEDNHICITVHHWQMIKLRLHRSEWMLIIFPCPQPILFVHQQVHRNNPVALCCKSIGQPAIPCTQVKDFQGTFEWVLNPRQDIFYKDIETASPDFPVTPEVTAQILKWQRTVILGGGTPSPLGAPYRLVVSD